MSRPLFFRVLFVVALTLTACSDALDKLDNPASPKDAGPKADEDAGSDDDAG